LAHRKIKSQNHKIKAQNHKIQPSHQNDSPLATPSQQRYNHTNETHQPNQKERNPMKIVKADIYAVNFPLKEPFIISYATYPSMAAVIVRLETDTGLEGYGEAVPDEHVTGEHVDGAFEILKTLLLPQIMNENPFNIEHIHHQMDAAIAGNPAAKAAVDIACYDLMGKAAGQPVYN